MTYSMSHRQNVSATNRITTVCLTIFTAAICHLTGENGVWVPDSSNVHVTVKNFSSGPQLEVVQVSPTSGYIQTPGWGNLSSRPKSMDSVVMVQTSHSQVVMVTFLRQNLTKNRRRSCDDKQITLAFYETSLANRVWLCGGKGRQPSRRYFSLNDLHFYVRLRSGKSRHGGFQLFFSVSEASAALRKVSNDAWNCSVPNFVTDFKPHFPCDMFPQCVFGEDERDCPYFSERCGLGFVTMGDYCLFYEKPAEKGSWRAMEFECVQRGAMLANLRTLEDYRRLTKYLEILMEFSGFTRIMVYERRMNYRYRREVQHTDQTVAFYRLTYVNSRVESFCGLIHARYFESSEVLNIGLEYCTRVYRGQHALCEMPQTPSKVKLKLAADKIQLQTVAPRFSASLSLLSLVACRLGHLTRDFLACDSESSCWARDAWSTSSSLSSCQAPVTPLPPSFACANGFEGVPYTLVCDVRADCSDDSDESFCRYPSCDLPAPFFCSDHECVPQDAVCDGQRNCNNAVDEDMCSDKESAYDDRPPPPAVMRLSRLGYFTAHSMTQTEACPETHFRCPGNGYCMPVFLRCNGVYDCLGRQDEANCHSYACPGFFRCRGSRACLHPRHLCDDIFQCPQNDDELLCDVSCPETCTCYGLAFYCRGPFINASDFTQLRFLDGRGSGIRVSDLTNNVMLVYLSVAANSLTAVGEMTFPNLRHLDLSDNRLKEILLRDLSGVPRLKSLSLSGNPLLSFLVGELSAARDSQNSLEIISLAGNASIVNVTSSGGNSTVRSLQVLHLSRVEVKVLNPTFLSLLPNLHTLNMSGGGVDALLGEEGFRALTRLRSLDLRGCPLTYFPRGVFRGLRELNAVYSDNYKLCCPATLSPAFAPTTKCRAPSDEISSCEALLRSDAYRVFLSAFASLSLLGNVCGFCFRVFLRDRNNKKKLLSFDVFVAHLCVADFLMGVYLGVIGVVDRLYRGTYLWEDNAWKNSAVCSAAGFLSLVSSEVSALVICLITVDRFLVLRFPFSSLRFGPRSSQLASLCVWGLGCLIAGVPLVPRVAARWRFYGQTGICVPLPVTRADSPSYTYAFGVMIVANFVFFVVIAAGQFSVYWSVRSDNSLSASETTRKTQDVTVARRLITVAMSDFLCWFPIGLAGILAATGTPISGEVNVALAIFVLPFNSALNPFLYTLNVVLEKQRKRDEARIRERLMAQIHSE